MFENVITCFLKPSLSLRLVSSIQFDSNTHQLSYRFCEFIKFISIPTQPGFKSFSTVSDRSAFYATMYYM